MDDNGRAFDVTTPEARKSALQEILAWRQRYWWVPFPIQAGVMLWKWASLYAVESSAKEIESQRKTAVEIIRAGRENNVDELEITMSEQAGIGLGSSIEGFPIQFDAGTQGKMTVKVKYKT